MKCSLQWMQVFEVGHSIIHTVPKMSSYYKNNPFVNILGQMDCSVCIAPTDQNVR